MVTRAAHVHILGSDFGVLSGGDISIVHHTTEVLAEGLGLAEQPVVLVGRLGQTHLAAPSSNRLLVRHNGVGFLAEGGAG